MKVFPREKYFLHYLLYSIRNFQGPLFDQRNYLLITMLLLLNCHFKSYWNSFLHMLRNIFLYGPFLVARKTTG